MNEDAWLACADYAQMLDLLHGKASDRKWRLFAVSCCPRIWQFLDEPSLEGLHFVERLADGIANGHERNAAHAAARNAQPFLPLPHLVVRQAIAELSGHNVDARESVAAIVSGAAKHVVFIVAGAAAGEFSDEEEDSSGEVARHRAWRRAKQDEEKAQSDLVREIFGNPFRPMVVDPRWLTSCVVDLARVIYHERVFDRMPILSDALMDAGCDSVEIIEHCRNEGPHVRGCWVVDLILGKE